jgi:eukaryotic-like serine/threonine-protein kinase
LIMELYDSNLKDHIEKRTLEEPEIRKIFAMICISIFFIHKNGIIHRDLKPHNILMKKIGDQTAFVITDFGIAKNKNV